MGHMDGKQSGEVYSITKVLHACRKKVSGRQEDMVEMVCLGNEDLHTDAYISSCLDAVVC